MSTITEEVGKRIRDARKVKGLTQKELSEILGVSETAVNRYESGQNFTLDTLSKIAQAIGISIESLVKGM